MEQARQVPLEDLYLLAAYAGIEAEEVRKGAGAPPGPGSSHSASSRPGGGGEVTRTQTVEYRLKSCPK
jgi:hypothetical protein